MQDDLLMDKNKAQPHHQQDPTQVDPPPSTPTPSSEPTSSSSESESPSSASVLNSRDKMPMESPILPGLSYHHQPQSETGGPLSSPSSSYGSTWSTGTTNSAVDDSFFQGIPSVNGTMLFQNFPHHVNPVFGGNFSPHMGLAPQSQQHQQQAQQQQQQQQQQPPQQPPQQRRSPVSPNQGPFPQRNAYQTIMNNSKVSSSSSGSSSAWNNHQNAAWSTASNPWSGLQAGRDPRRAVGVGVGVGVGVPSPLNPISPMKKPYSSNVIAPPKFPRPGPLTPKPWMEDSAFRTDNSNNILPFQDRNRPFDAFSLHSLENSLMDMIRTDHDKGKPHPAGGPPMTIADIIWRNHFAG
ncbi:cytoplasmic polyadenylation element-binding protein 3-like isoform X2 [Notothenia coriiceps]|nr:PREDICTED: cytoplasmic polyadenylation element-binding protein 3-like isoform X2 [Notothenia coriiceps]XP_010788454.1 PREDICTED: cytoplasmic polyadenylation element-binding protein 3-like isoform X2 [Notothenia coriiceps]XP_010788455.1 PREDICTED: cytoplasmic polyadenylation element-binding protein 3-like isoform X2 [Notothenia coriiceps]